MPVFLTDADVARLLAESKVLPPDYRSRLQVRPKRGHQEREMDVEGASGSMFRLILRQSLLNPLDFSVILACQPPNTSAVFRLRRFNGKSHEHTNKLEGSTFYDFHIHQATERYQQSGLREDTFAQATDRYHDFQSALRCLIADCGFILPQNHQETLF